MSRNFYILAAALGFFALLAAGMTFVPLKLSARSAG